MEHFLTSICVQSASLKLLSQQSSKFKVQIVYLERQFQNRTTHFPHTSSIDLWLSQRMNNLILVWKLNFESFHVYLGWGPCKSIFIPPVQRSSTEYAQVLHSLQMHLRNLKLWNLKISKIRLQKSKEITRLFHLFPAMHRSNRSSGWHKYESGLSSEFEKCTIYVIQGISRKNSKGWTRKTTRKMEFLYLPTSQ